MKFSAREDIVAPIDFVYGQVTDFAAIERAALRRGADVVRCDGSGPLVVGSAWDAKFTFRNKLRQVNVALSELDPPNAYKAETHADGLRGYFTVDLVPLSRQRTRLHVTLKIEAKTLSARLMLQSMKLARSSLNKRFKARVAGFAETIESRYA